MRQAGFSLLEVIVALAIMAFSLGALYHAAGGSMRGTQEAELRTRATALALSLLDSRSTIPAGGVMEHGVAGGGMRWALSSTPFPTGLEASPGWPLYQVEVQVGWGEGDRRHELRLTSLLPERAQVIAEAR